MVQLFPPAVSPATLSPQVWNVPTARSLPAVGKGLAIYTGLIGQMPLDLVRGRNVLRRPRLLERPDLDMARLNFVRSHVEDYLLHGNACHLVTAWGADALPAAVRWFPAWRWGIEPDEREQPVYRLDGKVVPRESVVHVQNGCDPAFPWRGMGMVEVHMRSLNRAGLESEAGAETARSRGMPAVAVITNQSDPPKADQDGRTAWDDAADKWRTRFAGSEPLPGFFPAGTQIVPLSWNPSDAQMVEARKLSLVDAANILNLDGYWLGAETSSHTYRSPGPLFLTLLRLSLAPVIDVFEDVWSNAWTRRGSRVRFDRTVLLQDDLQTMTTTFSAGTKNGLFTTGEAREYMGWPAELPEDPNAPETPPETPPETTEETPEETPEDQPPADGWNGSRSRPFPTLPDPSRRPQPAGGKKQ